MKQINKAYLHMPHIYNVGHFQFWVNIIRMTARLYIFNFCNNKTFRITKL